MVAVLVKLCIRQSWIKSTCWGLFASLSLLACTRKSTQVEDRHVLQLDHNLGRVILYLNSDFDTSYSWISHTDYKCGAKRNYKYGNKAYSLAMPSGFFPGELLRDSLYELNISHMAYSDCGLSNWQAEKRFDQLRQIRKAERPSDPYVRIEVKEINGRQFVVYDDYQCQGEFEYSVLQAFTGVRGYELCLTFNCRRSDCKDFKTKMESILNQIEILDGTN